LTVRIDSQAICSLPTVMALACIELAAIITIFDILKKVEEKKMINNDLKEPTSCSKNGTFFP
jgi:molybdenum cofactor biosynthesis enzyme